MEKISIRNKYKNLNNIKKENKIDNKNNISYSYKFSEDKSNEQFNNKKENKNEKKIENEIKKESKNEIKKLNNKSSPETSLLMSSYKNEIEKELSDTLSGYKKLKEDKKLDPLIKLLQIMKLCNTMNIVKNDKTAVEIIPQLYIGSMACASNLEELTSKKITHILCCGIGLKLFFPQKFKYYRIDLIDNESTNIRKYFDETNEFINDAIKEGGNILVHCYAGISRSTSIIIAYLMKYKKMNFNKSFELIKEKRGKIQPNSGFILQLKAYEKELGY